MWWIIVIVLGRKWLYYAYAFDFHCIAFDFHCIARIRMDGVLGSWMGWFCKVVTIDFYCFVFWWLPHVRVANVGLLFLSSYIRNWHELQSRKMMAICDPDYTVDRLTRPTYYGPVYPWGLFFRVLLIMDPCTMGLLFQSPTYYGPYSYYYGPMYHGASFSECWWP